MVGENAPTGAVEEGVVLVNPAAAEWRFTTQAAKHNVNRVSAGETPDPMTHRVARLFVAGHFPDKNLTVTEADLDGLILRFHANGARRPVQIEHMVGPLDPLGEVVGLHRCGPELFGLLVFSAGVEAHLQKRGVENVSVALVRENGVGEGDTETGGFSLKEVSLVLKGRIPSATLLEEANGHLHGAVNGGASLYDAKKGDETPAEKLARFRAGGKLTPATEPMAAILLSAVGPNQTEQAQSLTFGAGDGVGGAERTFAEVFAQFLDALPPVCSRVPLAAPNRNETRTSGPAASRAAFAMAARFGVSPQQLAARLK